MSCATGSPSHAENKTANRYGSTFGGPCMGLGKLNWGAMSRLQIDIPMAYEEYLKPWRRTSKSSGGRRK